MFFNLFIMFLRNVLSQFFIVKCFSKSLLLRILFFFYLIKAILLKPGQRSKFFFFNEHEQPINENLTIAKSLNFDEISLHPNTYDSNANIGNQ